MNISSQVVEQTTTACCLSPGSVWTQLATLDGLLAALVFVSVVALALAAWICCQRCWPASDSKREKASRSVATADLGSASTSSTSSSSAGSQSLQRPITTQQSSISASAAAGWMPSRALVANPWHPPDTLSPNSRRDFVPVLQSIRESPEQRCYGNRTLRDRAVRRSDSRLAADLRHYPRGDCESMTPTILPGKRRRVENPLYVTPSSEVNVKVAQECSPESVVSISSDSNNSCSSAENLPTTLTRRVSHSYPDLLVRGDDVSPYHLIWVSPDKQQTTAAAAVGWRQRSYSEPLLRPRPGRLHSAEEATMQITASAFKRAISTAGRTTRHRSKVASALRKKQSLHVNWLLRAARQRLRHLDQSRSSSTHAGAGSKRHRHRHSHDVSRGRKGRGVIGNKTIESSNASRPIHHHRKPSVSFRATSASEVHIKAVVLGDSTPVAHNVTLSSTSSSSSTCDCCRSAVTTATYPTGAVAWQHRATHIHCRARPSSDDVILQDYGLIGGAVSGRAEPESWSSRDSSCSSTDSPLGVRVADLHCSSASLRRHHRQAPSSMSAVMGSDTTTSGSTRSAATTAAIVNMSTRHSSLPASLDAPETGVIEDRDVRLDGLHPQRDVWYYQADSTRTRRQANASTRRTASATGVHRGTGRVTSDFSITANTRTLLPSGGASQPTSYHLETGSHRLHPRTSQGRSSSVREESLQWDNFPFWLATSVDSGRGWLESSGDVGSGEGGKGRGSSITAAVMEWDEGDDVFVNNDVAADDVIALEDMTTRQYWV